MSCVGDAGFKNLPFTTMDILCYCWHGAAVGMFVPVNVTLGALLRPDKRYNKDVVMQ